jgi:TusA-related sulfurtransferase
MKRGNATMKFEKKSEHEYLLDVKGYVCPHPQIYTKKALEKLQSGDILEVVFDNPSSGESISSAGRRWAPNATGTSRRPEARVTDRLCGRLGGLPRRKPRCRRRDDHG